MNACDSAAVLNPSALHGIDTVGVYIDGPSGSPSQIATLHAADKAVWLIYEGAAGAAGNGSGQGSADAQTVLRILAALHAPKGVAVYLAVDFDAEGSGAVPQVLNYFRAAAPIRHAGYLLGAYAGAGVLPVLVSAGVIDKAWQSNAWNYSGGYSGAVLRQQMTTSLPDGTQVDPDVVLGDIGAWGPPAHPTPPKGADMRLVQASDSGRVDVIGVPANDAAPVWAMHVNDPESIPAWIALGAVDHRTDSAKFSTAQLAALDGVPVPPPPVPPAS